MTTRLSPLEWTIEQVSNALRGGYYIFVPGSIAFLDQATEIWTGPNNQDIIYHTGYRIAGKEKKKC